MNGRWPTPSSWSARKNRRGTSVVCEGVTITGRNQEVPLTPALSPGERENRPPRFRQSRASRLVAARDVLSPLPAGEGQGEGNETPPTKTGGRVLQAQPDRRPEPEFAMKASVRAADGGDARSRKGHQFQ